MEKRKNCGSKWKGKRDALSQGLRILFIELGKGEGEYKKWAGKVTYVISYSILLDRALVYGKECERLPSR